MSTTLSKKKSIKSPVKKSAKDSAGYASNDVTQQKQEELITGINEREVEIEHLKTTMIALDEKVKVMDDIKQDISNTRRDLGESEAKREELQEHIEDTGEKVGVETKKHTTYQEELIAENNDLRQQIQGLKQQMAFKERDWLDTKNQQEDRHERSQKALQDKMDKQREDFTQELIETR